MAAANDSNDPGYWPGFVAAIAGLVQGMLIMAMVLAISLYVLGQLASMAHLLSGRYDAVEDARFLRYVNEAILKSAQAKQFDLQKTAELPSDNNASAKEPPPIATLEFTDRVVQIPRSAQKDFLETVQQVSAQGAQHWRIEVATDAQDTARQHSAFLRLMAVRSLLMQSGVSASDIVTRAIDAGNNSETDRVQVFSVKSPPLTMKSRNE